ncbi:hypothetical protein RhiJN_26857 [Ceratobasidium sp. AG-Ba]|nr:hypothetical protein RhiJN_26857 [Ceratobasidium sp. AG-Ba]
MPRFPGPSGAFEGQVDFSLDILGFDETPGCLLASLIMNVMVLMTTTPRFKLQPIATWLIFSLGAEIEGLCAIYGIKDVEFQFDSALDAPAQLINDFFNLGISGSMLNKNPMYWKHSNYTLDEIKLLLKFFELVRALMDRYHSEGLAEVLYDYESEAPLLPDYLRRTGVGARFPTPQPVFTPRRITREFTKPSVRFNPFGSRSRRAKRTSHPRKLDLDAEASPALLSDAPLRMKGPGVFGFGRF